jgi:hypothetical protein
LLLGVISVSATSNESDSVNDYNKLIDSFKKQGDDIQYPDYYGGASDMEEIASIFEDVTGFGIAEDINKITVCIHNISDEKIAEFKEMISNSDAITFEAGQFATPN